MLQAIREKAGSFIVKILFLLLIASFAVWGIGDIFRSHSGDTTIAEVGDHKIRAEELQVAVRDEMTRLRAMFGGEIDMEQAKQLGLVNQTLDRIVTRELVGLETQRLGLVVGDEALRRAIQSDPIFHNSSGTFDRTVYNRVLANNRMSEPQYEARLRRDLARGHLVEAVTSGAEAPSVLVDPLYRTRNEKRVVDTVFLPLDSAGDVGEPSDAEIAEYYEANNERFRAPEYRGFTALVLTADAVAAEITVPEEKLREEYAARAAEFETPERREVEQILVADEAKAKEAEEALAGGKDFAAVAKEVANQDAEAIKLGWVTRSEMPDELADVVFSAEQGKPTAPVQSPFGWHIIKVVAIQPGHVESFEEAHDKLKAQIAHDLAADRLFSLSNEIEDALAGGSSLEEVGKKFNIAPVVVAASDPNGRTPQDEPVTLPAAGADVLRTAFETAEGQVSRMTETRDGAFYIVRVDKVTPSAIRPLADVRGTVVELWKTDKKTAAVEARAKEIAEAVGKGKTLAELAEASGLKVETSAPFLRTGAGANGLPGTLVSQAFAAAPGAAFAAAGTGGSYVAQVKSVDRPDPAANAAAVEQLSRQVQANIASDLAAGFERSLRSRFGVSIHEAEIQRLF